MRSRRKLVLGMIGGFIGGAVGGAVFDPINRATNNDVLARVVAISVIGMLTGLCIATVENVAKKGWLKVVEGVIAGKQFIIYHNPTIIGSDPRCEIFLFKDDGVLKHHAMLYIVAAGYVLEDLGSGGTLVNNRPVDRVHLRDGDRIRIGRTRFTFHETGQR
jgi:pSer/pThr/pTyr-binding forkhead associated (FHA) protein